MSGQDWTDADEISRRNASISSTHPVGVLKRFFEILWSDVENAADILLPLVTPESRQQWSTFDSAQAFVRQDLAMSDSPLRAIGAKDVVYIKIVRDPQKPRLHAPSSVNALAWATLVWRPELSGWRIHAIGQQLDPKTLPRSSPGQAPAF